MSQQKVLLIKNRGLGDAIMGLSALNYLRKQFSDSYICYAVPTWVVPIFQNSHADFDEIYPLETSGAMGMWSFGKYLLRSKFDIIIELNQRGRTAKLLKLYSRLFGKKYYFHNHQLRASDCTPIHDQGITKPSIQRDLDAIWSLNDNSIRGSCPQYLDYPPHLGNPTKLEKKYKVILGVVSSKETKCWPFENFVKLVGLLEKSFPQIEFIIPVSKSKVDYKANEYFNEVARNNARVNIVHSNLSSLPQLFEECVLYIGNDTGLKHLAVSLNISTFTFFGPEDPLEWHPYDQSSHKYFFIKDLECRYVDSHFCGLSKCSHLSCMKLIQVQKVYEQVFDFFKSYYK